MNKNKCRFRCGDAVEEESQRASRTKIFVLLASTSAGFSGDRRETLYALTVAWHSFTGNLVWNADWQRVDQP